MPLLKLSETLIYDTSTCGTYRKSEMGISVMLDILDEKSAIKHTGEQAESLWSQLLALCERDSKPVLFSDKQITTHARALAEEIVYQTSKNVSGWVDAQNIERAYKMPGAYLIELFAKVLGETIAKHWKK